MSKTGGLFYANCFVFRGSCLTFTLPREKQRTISGKRDELKSSARLTCRAFPEQNALTAKKSAERYS